jgi:hypothetical protein
MCHCLILVCIFLCALQSFLRDLASFGDRFKKVKTFRANIIRVRYNDMCDNLTVLLIAIFSDSKIYPRILVYTERKAICNTQCIRK